MITFLIVYHHSASRMQIAPDKWRQHEERCAMQSVICVIDGSVECAIVSGRLGLTALCGKPWGCILTMSI